MHRNYEELTMLLSMICLACMALFVGIYTATEIYITTFGKSNNGRDVESSSGTTFRRYFQIIISFASFMRLFSLLILALYYSYEIKTNNDEIQKGRNIKLIELSRFLPTCLYISVYTMVTLYFAQMCYTVSMNSVSVFQLRNVFIAGNIITYSFILVFIIAEPLESAVYWILFISYSILFISTVFYGYSLFKLLPGSTAHHQLTARKVMARFFPLLMICGISLLLGVIYYLVLILNILPTSRQYVFDFIAFSLTEVIPSLFIVLLLTKKNNSGVNSDNTLTVDNSSNLPHILKSYIASKLTSYNSIPSNDVAITVRD